MVTSMPGGNATIMLTIQSTGVLAFKPNMIFYFGSNDMSYVHVGLILVPMIRC